MKRILVASDLSGRSDRALKRALALARQNQSVLCLLHVVDDDGPPSLIEEISRCAGEALREALARLGGNRLDPAPVALVRRGDPFRAIIDEADRRDVDLVVMGSHRKRLLRDVFTGTTVERVMRLGRRPVLMVNRDGDAPYSRVLAAVDRTQASADALLAARRLGLLDPARDAVVHAFMPLAEGMMFYAGIDRERIDDQISSGAARARAAIVDFLYEHGFGAMSKLVLVEKGTPFEAIGTAIRKRRSELLVIGTRGHEGMARIMLGSVADEVLRKAGCDVLAVAPAPED
jgi:nucleotide-binding universal stress UspA family protein